MGKGRRGTDESELPLRAKPHALPGCATDFRLAGFEPATLRYHEVPELFTTGLRCAAAETAAAKRIYKTHCTHFAQLRPASWPMKTRMAGNERCCRCPFGRLSYGISAGGICTHVLRSHGALRSNRHLHHCHHAGERAIPALRQSKRRIGLATSPEPATHPLHRADSTVRSIEGGFFTACGVKYPKSSPPAFFGGIGDDERGRAAVVSMTMHSPSSPPKPNCKTNIVVTLSNMTRHQANPLRFALPSVDRDRSRRSLQQAPRLWHARSLARARDPGLPFFTSLNEPLLWRTKKPSGALAREGS